jgi:hypothetical protein
MATATPTLKFTIGQYDLMIEAGVFARPPTAGEFVAEPPRVELRPGPLAYAEHRVASRGESITPPARPEAVLAVDSLFATRG